MNNRPSLSPPPLTDKSQPWCRIVFDRTKDGKTVAHSFHSVINRLTGDRCSAFNLEPPFIGDSVAWVASVLRDITADKANSNIEIAGTIKPAPPITE